MPISIFVIVILAVVALPLFVMAGFLLRGRGAWLISGYNMLSEAERARYDEPALCRFMGRLLIAINCTLILLMAGAGIGVLWLTFLAFALMLIVLVGGIVYAGGFNYKRFRIKGDFKEEENAVCEPRAKGQKRILLVGAAVCGIALIGVIVLIVAGEREPVLVLEGESIRILGMYGVQVELSSVVLIELMDESMREIGSGMRINGYGGRSLRGHFTSGLLFVRPDSSPTIRIERAGQPDIYLSFANGEQTRQVHQFLVAGWGGQGNWECTDS